MFGIYKPSGRFAPLALALLPLAAVGVAASAFAYQLGLKWIPFIYVNFVLSWLMGIVIGICSKWVIKRGHVRSIAVGLMICGLLTATGLGAKFWFQYLTSKLEFRQELGSMNQNELGIESNRPLTPAELNEVRGEIANNYSFLRHLEMRVARGWRIGRGGNVPLSGPFVYLVWLLELGIIGFYAGVLAKEAAEAPYSEKLGQWADSRTTEMHLPVTNESMVSQIKAARSVQELLELPVPDSYQSDKLAVYEVSSVPGFSEEDAYLTVDLQTHSRTDKGELEVNHEYLVKLAIITAAQRAQLRENAEVMQEALAAYRASLESPADESDAPPGQTA